MKIAFIDHSFHKKTVSSQFLVELLRRKGVTVELLWDESWCGGEHVDFDGICESYDAFVFWQQLPWARKKFHAYNKPITYVPMFDNFGCDDDLHHSRRFWYRFPGVKVLAFSRALHSAVLSHGVASRYVQYFPDPEKYDVKKNRGLTGFFWQRRPDQVNWQTVKRLIGNTEFERMHIHLSADPGVDPYVPDRRDVRKYNITFSEWFADRSEYIGQIRDCSVYFAPRKSEGIGMSFLEAMAMGKCVVSPDFGTMNDYINDGLNGFLYDMNRPGKIDFERIEAIRKNARLSVESGFEKWKRREREIVDYILADHGQVYRDLYHYDIRYPELQMKPAAGIYFRIRRMILKRLSDKAFFRKVFRRVRKVLKRVGNK